MMKILLASGNKGKLREMRALLTGLDIEIVSPDDVGLIGFDVVEDGATFEENAMIKARAYAKETGLAAVADDSGLEVEALGGAPGIYSARYGDKSSDVERTEFLLSNMVSEDMRAAKFVSVIAFCADDEFTVRGECHGELTREQRGDAGFGYDPIFLYKELGMTFAELSQEEKNKISHRAKSMAMFRERIKKYVDIEAKGKA